MDADEIIQLTPSSVEALLEAARSANASAETDDRRETPRWPFPGTVQLWITDETGAEQMVFGTCYNLSTAGLGMRTDETVPPGHTVPLAIHLPQASYHGRAVVRHCTSRSAGHFVGLEFVFD